MDLGRQFIACHGGPSTSTFHSLAFVARAATVPCGYSEEHPDARADVDRPTQETVTSTVRARLSVNVLATTDDGTRRALGAAKRLVGSLDAHVVLLLPRLTSLAGGFDPTSQERNALVDKHRALAAEVGVHVHVLFCVCRRYDEVVHQMLGRSSLLIIGGRKRIWWPTAEERLVSRLAKEGYPVVFAQSGLKGVFSC